MWRGFLSAFILLSSAVPAAADAPATIARDFCHAVAAQARCKKLITMPADTESRLEQRAGGKLRGEESPLKHNCKDGYDEFHAVENANGVAAACSAALRLFGPRGTRRAGLVIPRVKPAMKLPEDEIAAIAKDLCHAATVADICPGLSLAPGIEETLAERTGVELRDKAGYFASECGSGVFAASLAKGKVDQADFCTAAMLSYGPHGLTRAGLLDGPAPTTATAPTIAIPVETTPKRRSTPVAAAEVNDLPPLPAGKTPAEVLGLLPGTAAPADCTERAARVTAAKGRLDHAATLADEIQHAVRLGAESRVLAALCPGQPVPALPKQTVAAVRHSGLDACHVVFLAVDDLNASEQEYRAAKLYRAVLAVGEAKLWALEAFADTCSPLTKRAMDTRITFARKLVARNAETYPCRIWQEFFRAEAADLRGLTKDKDWDAAVTLLETRLAPAIHGMAALCEEKSVDANKSYWLSQRRFVETMRAR